MRELAPASWVYLPGAVTRHRVEPIHVQARPDQCAGPTIRDRHHLVRDDRHREMKQSGIGARVALGRELRRDRRPPRVSIGEPQVHAPQARAGRAEQGADRNIEISDDDGKHRYPTVGIAPGPVRFEGPRRNEYGEGRARDRITVRIGVRGSQAR